VTDAQLRPAPNITLKSAGSGRQVTLNKEGLPLVLLCVAQGTAGGVEPIREAVRHRYPDARTVVIASVVDLKGVPRLMRKMAEGVLNNRYKENAARLDEGKDARDYVVILPDWKGEVAPALGIADVGKQLGVAVISSRGEITGVYQGDDPAAAAVEILERAGA
jgi:hypothetical protein